MPLYEFENPITKEKKSIIQGMNDSHIFVDNEGVEWVRIFINPQASFNTKIDPLSSKDFVEKTRGKKGSVGNILDKSKELSEQREKITGRDIIKDKWYDSYAKRRHKKLHPDVVKQKGKEKLSKMGVDFED